MFGFFKKDKQKKKKGDVIEYNPSLIKKFCKAHEKLEITINKVLEDTKKQDFVAIRKSLKQLRLEILGHFMEEDISLYRYLEKYYENDENTLELIMAFESSIKEIQKGVLAFLDKYIHKNANYDKIFEARFMDIVESLTTRVEAEENNLYTLYIK